MHDDTAAKVVLLSMDDKQSVVSASASWPAAGHLFADSQERRCGSTWQVQRKASLIMAHCKQEVLHVCTSMKH